jgi:hypothetical protein
LVEPEKVSSVSTFFVQQQKNFLGRFQISLECEAEDKPDKN